MLMWVHKRSRILDAISRLSDARLRLEDYFLDERAYVDASGRCGVLPSSSVTDSFAIQCEATATTFTVTATGIAAKGMTSFVYAIDQLGTKSTVSVPPGWSRTAGCWTIRQDGSCA